MNESLAQNIIFFVDHTLATCICSCVCLNWLLCMIQSVDIFYIVLSHAYQGIDMLYFNLLVHYVIQIKCAYISEFMELNYISILNDVPRAIYYYATTQNFGYIRIKYTCTMSTTTIHLSPVCHFEPGGGGVVSGVDNAIGRTRQVRGNDVLERNGNGLCSTFGSSPLYT